MMKNRFLITLIVLAILFTTACSSQDRTEELQTGKYVMKDAQTEDWAWITLEDNNKFEFNRGSNTSYRPTGTYSVENDELLLKVSDTEIYRFEIKVKDLIFEGGEYAEGLIDVGAIFELTNND